MAIAVVGAWCAGLAIAQPVPAAKPPPRLPPAPAEQARIPAGADTGTPGTSDTLPLGTPVPPAIAADRSDLRLRSAGARAAARKSAAPASGASAAAAAAGKDCPPRAASGSAPLRKRSTVVGDGC